MEEKKIKRLKRSELLELLVTLSEENDVLREENCELQRRLQEREIILQDVGSIAEASLKLSGIFEAAQKAADLYLENVKRIQDTGMTDEQEDKKQDSDRSKDGEQSEADNQSTASGIAEGTI